MRRNLSNLERHLYDLVIVGGGVYGASIARDAALRGLKVALVEQADFGSGTSANSHKIIHGGLRYLQHADLKRMRESMRERSTLMRIAPHLVHPMPFLIPGYRKTTPGKFALSMAMKINDFIGADRNKAMPGDKVIPKGRVLSKEECLKLCPGLSHEELAGAALYYDGHVSNPERFMLSLLRSAAMAGADLANYVKVTGFLQGSERIYGLLVCDTLTQKPFKVRAKMVVNCTGPWQSKLLGSLSVGAQAPQTKLMKALVLVTRQLTKGIAVGIPGRRMFHDRDAVINKGHRYFFITPWRNSSLIGTLQLPYKGKPEDFQPTEEDIAYFLREFDAAYPSGKLTRKDVKFVYGGLLPMENNHGSGSVISDARLIKHYEIHDHEELDGLKGLISVMGVKFTTARGVGEKVVDLVMKKRGRASVPNMTAFTPIYGGDIENCGEYFRKILKKRPPNVPRNVMLRLVRNYGSKFGEVLQYGRMDHALLQPVVESSLVTGAEVIHGIRGEMAQRLEDVIFRRTELGNDGFPGEPAIHACAELMAGELGWSAAHTQDEIEHVMAGFTKRGCREGEISQQPCAF